MFDLTRVHPLRSVPQIEVTFRIGVNGILEVTAADQRTTRGEQVESTSRGITVQSYGAVGSLYY
ncbi:hypothetical protein E1B28_003749 [Marasmius oreades]|uniref:Uncharacterized protein n=1 Tax=Marasmius oreades TaxID=181124 RepID=A0A9P7UXA9_9AGAR|nr:uncharacterized protein E1B28_003749 [Marasmius oreades]KAG7096303.1 hypothetical protein E1B28_003749 [Marasmius oreades]